MTDNTLDGVPDDELARFQAFRPRVAGTNISSESLLATDYLNHFNEIVMLMEMVPDMPEILEDCKAWAPRSYCDHFRCSSVADKDLAIEAYEFVPTKFRKPFEETVEQINGLIMQSLAALESALSSDENEQLRMKAVACSRATQALLETASAIIHGASITMQQDQIDSLLEL